MKTQVSVWQWIFAMISISLGFWVTRSPTEAHPLLEPWQNRTASHAGLLLEPVGGFFYTANNFEDSGSVNSIQNGATNTRVFLDVNTSYGISDHFFLFGRLSLVSTQVSILGQTSLSGLGLGDQLIGAAYRVLSTPSGIGLNLQGEASFPGYSNTNAKTSGSAYLGDGSIDLTGGAFLELPLNQSKEVYFETGAGFTYRSKGFSSAIPYSAILKKDPLIKGLILEGGITGQFSLKTDIATNDTGLRTVLDQDRLTGAGGSYLLNAMNPSWIQAGGKIGVKNGYGHRFFAAFAMPVIAANAPSGFGISLGATLDFGPHPEEASSKGSPKTNGRQSSLSPKKEFTTYNLEAKVTQYNDHLYLIRIDRGSTDNIERGQLFDVFQGDTPIARAKITQVKDEESVLSVLEYFKEMWIEEGFTVRRLVR